MAIGLGETVFPFQIIFASGRYMIGISYPSAPTHITIKEEGVPLRDVSVHRRLRNRFDRMQ